VSYKKNNEHFKDQIDLKLEQSASKTHLDRLSQIKAELSSSNLITSASDSNNSLNNNGQSVKRSLNQLMNQDNNLNQVQSASDLLFGPEPSPSKTAADNLSESIDLNDVSLGVQELDLSTKSQDNNNNNNNSTTMDVFTNEEDTLAPLQSNTNKNNTNSNDEPVDFSMKSRALYESFRGKVNTLERHPYKKKSRSQLSSVSSQKENINQNYRNNSAAFSIASSFDSESLSGDNNQSSSKQDTNKIGSSSPVKNNYSNNNLARDTIIMNSKLREEILNQSLTNSNEANNHQTSSSNGDDKYSHITKLQRQISIKSDRSLHSTVDDHIYK
jgi:hypothetical protein